MTNANSYDSTETKNYFVTFNQDSTSLAVGSRSGFRLYSLQTCDELEQIYRNDVEDTCIVERLFSSSLIAVVLLSAPRKLKVCHYRRGTEICNYSYSNTILAVRLNRDRLIVCVEENLYIHNIKNMKLLHTIRDTPKNPKGICALCISCDNCLLAYPGSATIGEVQIFDAHHLQARTMIPAHDSPLAAIAFNPLGTQIATASEKGTVIRVFSTGDGQKLYEFRRGMKRCVDICSLSFSMCSTYLCCSSNTETVHVFKLEPPPEMPGTSMEEGSWVGYLSAYLPTQVTDVFTQGRAFATAYLPKFGVRNVTSISVIQKTLTLLVATESGTLYIYQIDPKEGGDLTLYKEIDISVPKGTSTPTAMQKIVRGSAILGSYAGIVKGTSKGQMSGTESDKVREISAAAGVSGTPPSDEFPLGDEQEYPPLTQNSD